MMKKKTKSGEGEKDHKEHCRGPSSHYERKQKGSKTSEKGGKGVA